MISPVLKERPLEEGARVLLLDEESLSVTFWFTTIFVEVVRASADQPTFTYKVHLSVNCQALDLMVAFERYLPDIIRPRLYYRGTQVCRDNWLGEPIDGATLILLEDGAKREEGDVHMFRGGMEGVGGSYRGPEVQDCIDGARARRRGRD